MGSDWIGRESQTQERNSHILSGQTTASNNLRRLRRGMFLFDRKNRTIWLET
jgi:hypothetical protein